MHRQTEARERRLLAVVPDPASASDVVAVVVGAGNRRLYESLGAAALVEGGQSMNPSTRQLVEAIDSTAAPEVVLLPNNENVVLAAQQAAELAQKPAHVVPTTSIQAGLAALVAFNPERRADENATEMAAATNRVATGAVTRASREVRVNGRGIGRGEYLGLLEGEPFTGGDDFDAVARAVVERLLERPRDIVTLLTGAEEHELENLVRAVEDDHPELDVEVHAGGQPHYPLLISAE